MTTRQRIALLGQRIALLILLVTVVMPYLKMSRLTIRTYLRVRLLLLAPRLLMLPRHPPTHRQERQRLLTQWRLAWRSLKPNSQR